jgi:precorrin-6B methylase 2
VEHKDHVNLLRQGVPGPGGIWADLGSGAGAFTLALTELIEQAGQIHSVDRDRRARREQERIMRPCGDASAAICDRMPVWDRKSSAACPCICCAGSGGGMPATRRR